ncbi:META and DUF4377 domain-containing protein [Crenobacter cavernae]|nr:META and DUF4377 domain-containing protein [Crenobacter cavernae]
MKHRLIALVAACAAAPAFAFPNLAGTEWQLDTPRAENPPTLRFDAGKATGFGGCNRYVWTHKDGKSLVAATRMLCAPAAMQTEQAFFKLLEARPRLVPDGRATKLALVAGSTRYEFRRVKTEQPTTAPAVETSRYLTVAPFTAPCSAGVAKMQCLQVRESDSGDWQNFYGGIEGFTPQPGIQYTLKVRVIPIANPPADAPNRRVVLERVVMQEKTEKLN